MRLLIVDDHDMNLKLLRVQLENAGHSVRQAVDGIEALDILGREAFDGVISDILMPRMDGYRLCMEVRSRPTLAHLPFVLYTSTYNSPGDRQLAASIGADAYLSKPAPTAQIIAALLSARERRPDQRTPAEQAAGLEPAPLMKQYNEVLVRKLEEKGIELERAHEALRESEAGLRRAQDVAGMAHAIVNVRGDVLGRSDSFGALLGLGPEDAPRNRDEWLQHVHEDDRPSILDAARHTRATGGRSDFEYRVRRDGGWRRIRHHLELLEDGSGEEGQLTFNTLQDITAEHQAKEKIQQLNHVYAVLSGINSLIVHAADRDELFQQACRILVDTGRFAKAWIGLVDEGVEPIRILAWAGGEDAYFEDLQQRFQAWAEGTPKKPSLLSSALGGQGPVICNDIANDQRVSERQKLVQSGSFSLALLPIVLDGRTVGVLSIHSTVVGFFDEQETGLLLELVKDISFALDHMIKGERIAYLAHHDALTGLPNRALFSELLLQQLHDPKADGHLTCVAVLDLARFRRINETLGRPAGDDLLSQVAERLRGVDPFVARLGADLFALQFHERRSAAELARDFEHLAVQCFQNPFLVGGQEIRMGCRIGAAVVPGDGDDPETLLRNAESALRRARAASEVHAFYAPDMNAAAGESLALESKLRRAIEHGEFVLHYQPKLRLSDRRICGVEALIRWQEPGQGLVPPMRFIPVLEDAGLIGTVGKWAMERALEAGRQWRAAGARPVRIAVNVSALQLNHPNFAAQVAALLGAGDREALELEITESVIMDDVDRKIAMLSEIRDAGVTVSVDDFGTGYSSLAYISRLPINSLKIDRAFITGMTAGPQGHAIVSSIIALAHALQLRVVAEGVETAEQAAMLAQLGCEEGQGYLFSRPVSEKRFLEMLLADLPLG